MKEDSAGSNPMFRQNNNVPVVANISNAEDISAAFKNAELFKTSGFGHTRILANKDVVNKIVEFVKPK